MFIVLLGCLGPVPSFVLAATGQTSAVKVSHLPLDSAFSNEPLVIVSRDTRFHLASDGTGFNETTVVARIQSEPALKQTSVLRIPFAARSSHPEWIYARVRHADGTVSETPVHNAIEIASPVTQAAPFYSDLKESQLPLRDLRVGDTLEWKARIVLTTAEAPGQFWGQDNFMRDGVVLAETVELEVPKASYVNVWSPKFKPVESLQGDQRVFRWQHSETAPTVGAAADAAREKEKKRIRTAEEEVDLREGKLPDLAWTTFHSWAEVGAWYRQLEADREVPDAEIKSKVATLTAGKATEQEKVQAVYAYVAMQIHYVGVAFGVGRYQPHHAAEVLEKQYGDCKDKHTLLASMLRALGLNPDAALVGVGIRFNQDVPSPASFNHLITQVAVDGKPVWLDTTAEVAPYGMLLSVVRDREALVIPASGSADLARTPARPPFAPETKWEAVGTLDADGLSNSRVTLTFHGDGQVLMRQVLRQLSPAQYDAFAQQFCQGLGYVGTASHLQASSLDDLNAPFQISFDYTSDKAGDWPNHRTVAQLMPVELARPDLKDPPVQDIELGTPQLTVSHATMKLPKGWRAQFPEAVHEKSSYANYDQTYRFENGTMYVDRWIEIFKDRVPVEDWKSYSKFIEKVDAGNDQWIDLLAPGSSGAEDSRTGDAVAASNPRAAQLVLDAYNSVTKNDLTAAEPLLEQARAINPEQAYLWSTYGYLSYQRGDYALAIDDYNKELKIDPQRTQVFEQIVNTQLRLRERPEAEATLKLWLAADKPNPAPALGLATLLLEDSSAGEAASIAAAALALRSPGDSQYDRLQLILGHAQLQGGTKENGRDTLTTLLKQTTDPAMINDAAYLLADAGLELPLAEQRMQWALGKMEEQSRSWTLDEDQAKLLKGSRLLQASWDTMGWIEFRSGKLRGAQMYVDASWRGRQSAEVGRHRSQIAAALGDKAGAARALELAEVLPGGQSVKAASSAGGVLLLSPSARAAISHKNTALQAMRTAPLGPARGLDGVGEYKLLFHGDEVLRAASTGGRALTGGQDRLKAARFAGLTPSGSEANLVLLGMLNCHSGKCELMLEP